MPPLLLQQYQQEKPEEFTEIQSIYKMSPEQLFFVAYGQVRCTCISVHNVWRSFSVSVALLFIICGDLFLHLVMMLA